jgi:hypothetical protein
VFRRHLSFVPWSHIFVLLADPGMLLLSVAGTNSQMEAMDRH